MRLRFLLIPLLVAMEICSAFGNPLTLADAIAPDRKHELVITRTTENADGEVALRLSLREVKNGKVLHSVPIETDESDYRKSIGAHWSPNSRYVAVNEHLGQLYWFTIYDTAGGKLATIPEAPIPRRFVEEYFTPEATTSRGGQQVQRWLDAERVIVADTMYRVDITFRVNRERKLEVVQVAQWPE